MSQLKIYVTPYIQYGHTRYFPNCENAQRLCRIKGKKTISPQDVELLKEMGVPVVAVPQDMEPYIVAERLQTNPVSK
jgi:hypothetical protein